MFGFLFGKKKAAADANTAPAAATTAAPGTAIRYDERLVPLLEADHKQLLEVFTAISHAAKSEDLGEVQKLLERFRVALNDHLLKENVRLYVYLEHNLASDPPSQDLMRGFRREMDGIGRAVTDFLTRYKNIGSEPELAALFARELGEIGEALGARIQREEGTLYPLYAPPTTG